MQRRASVAGAAAAGRVLEQRESAKTAASQFCCVESTLPLNVALQILKDISFASSEHSGGESEKMELLRDSSFSGGEGAALDKRLRLGAFSMAAAAAALENRVRSALDQWYIHELSSVVSLEADENVAEELASKVSRLTVLSRVYTSRKLYSKAQPLCIECYRCSLLLALTTEAAAASAADADAASKTASAVHHRASVNQSDGAGRNADSSSLADKTVAAVDLGASVTAPASASKPADSSSLADKTVAAVDSGASVTAPASASKPADSSSLADKTVAAVDSGASVTAPASASKNDADTTASAATPSVKAAVPAAAPTSTQLLVFEAASRLALVCDGLKEFLFSRTLHNEIVEMAGQFYGHHHERALSASHRLALHLRSAGCLQEALEVAQQVMGVRTQRTETSLEEAASAELLGWIHENLEQWDEALSFHQRALDLRRQHAGPDHADTRDSLNSMARILRLQGADAKAEVLLREAFTSATRVLGEHDTSALSAAEALASCLR